MISVFFGRRVLPASTDGRFVQKFFGISFPVPLAKSGFVCYTVCVTETSMQGPCAMMKSETLRDRLLQVIGLIVLAVLTVALIFAFHEKMLPQQEEGDVFGTVYALTSGDESEKDEESGSAPSESSEAVSSDTDNTTDNTES